MTVAEQAPSTRPYAPPRLPGSQADPGEEELVSRAAGLVPLLARHAAETERLRRLPDTVIDALQAAGLLRITIPRRFGGYQVSLETKVRVAAELARGCGSTSWTVSLINVCNWFTALYPERAQQDVWAGNPDAKVAGVFAPSGNVQRADGGQVVSGEWAWASGSLHADWAVIGIPMPGDGGTPADAGLALVPMADLSIKDTWFTTGMRGTGSNTLVAQHVFIPDYRVVSFTKAFEGSYPREDKDEALYRSAFMPYATAILAGPQLGLARAAFDLILAKSARRGIAYTVYQRQTDSPGFRLAMAEAALRIDGAYLHALRVIREIDASAAHGPYPDYLARAHARAGISHAVKEAREAIRILVSAHGASSFAETNDLQRIWRDAEVASRHAIVSPETNADLFGSALVGLPPVQRHRPRLRLRVTRAMGGQAEDAIPAAVSVELVRNFSLLYDDVGPASGCARGSWPMSHPRTAGRRPSPRPWPAARPGRSSPETTDKRRDQPMTAPTDLGHRATVPLAPGAWPVIGHAWPLLRDPLAFLASLPAHGGLVQVRLGGLAAVVVCDPGLTREVLLDDRTYDKGGPIYDGLREWVGDGIASSPHRTHRRQRRLIQPAFHPGRIPGYAETMAARIAAATGRWHEGQVIDVVPELLAITMQTTVETMFSGVLTPQALREAVEDFTTVVVGIFWRMLLPPLLKRLPTPGNHRYHQARSRLRHTVDAVLCDRRAEPRGTDHGDLLSALLAQDPADGGLSDTEVSDQILTFLAAGAETTAATVSWALHLLSGHPGLRDQVYAEVDTVLAGAPVGPQHLPQLELTGRVVTEAVRLYPPGWLLTRTVTADTTLGGHTLPAGTTVFYSPYLIHHRADLFTAPDSFIPDRWAPGVQRPQRDAFVAFGGGARRCPGEQFGLTEATLALACITAAWHLEPARGRPVRPAVAAALKPRGLMMRATARTITPAGAEQGAR